MSSGIRKTVPVAFVLERANLMLRRTDVSDDYREAAAWLLETILHETGNYQGFNYLTWCEEGGVEKWRADGGEEKNLSTEPYLGNQTRRVYYGPRNVPKGKSTANFPKRLR